MKTSVTVRASLWLAVCAVCAMRGMAEPAQPAGEGEAGRKAWELLGASYQGQEGLAKAVAAALSGLKDEEPTLSAASANLLSALFRQAAADEKNGRAEWRRTPAWGGGGESSARGFRESLAGRLEKAGATAAAVPVAVALLGEDRLPVCLRAAIAVLEKCHDPASDHAIQTLLERGSHWRPALVMALHEAGKRGLRDATDAVGKLAADPRESVRSEAVAALKSLGVPAPPPFQPEEAFSPALEKLLHDVLALLPDALPADARFGVFETEQDFGGKPYRHSVTGWLLGQRDGAMRGISWHGEGLDLRSDEKRKIKVTFTGGDPVKEAARIRSLREGGKGGAGRDERLEVLSYQGGLTGQFESPMLSAPEALLAAWLFRCGDRKTAALLLFPALDQLDDDRWAFDILRDLIGQRCHQAMLDEFAFNRDYAKTLRLAEHLSQPLFDGYIYQERAKELARQLPRRMDDFHTHVLPEPAEWEKLKSSMTRQAQLEFLAERLRLLNCHQQSQPGGIDYDQQQYRDAGGIELDTGDQAKAVKVINPWQELAHLRPKPDDIPILAPFLKDEDFLPAYSYWRDFHPARTLHRVNWLVADLVNDAAMRTLIDLRGWQDLDAAARDRSVEKVMNWARDMAGKTPAEVIGLNMEQAPNADEWLIAARAAAHDQTPSLMSALLAGAKKYPDQKAAIARLCFHHGSPAALSAAKGWLKSRDATQRLYAALIAIRHGNADDRRAARAKLNDLMAGPWDESVLVGAVEPALSLRDTETTAALCKLLERKELEESWSFGAVAHHLFLSDHPAVLAALVKGLSSTANPKTETGSWQGKEVKTKQVRGDRTAQAVANMRKGYQYPSYAPAEDRAVARADLAAWLKEQATRRKAGQDTPELDTKPAAIRVAQWHVDAP